MPLLELMFVYYIFKAKGNGLGYGEFVKKYQIYRFKLQGSISSALIPLLLINSIGG